MFRHELVVQSPDVPGVIAAEIERLAGEGDFDRLRGIFAFATAGGAEELIEILTKRWNDDWEKTQKRWLISADFGFTDPLALRALAGLSNSQVRIPDGPYLLKNQLRPRVTHHAKALILDQRQGGVGNGPFGLMVGSANLTVSALSGNLEAVAVFAWNGQIGKRDQARLATAQSQVNRFDRTWRKAAKLDEKLLEEYELARKRVHKSRSWPEQERRPMVRKASERNAGSFELAAAMRAATKFWIQTGNMYKNLGDGGNQVDMKAGSRVFFGFSNRRVPKNQLLGEIGLAYWGNPASLRHLRYGNNSMDKIYLPNPGTEGAPSTYVKTTLLFERLPNGSFRFKIGDTGDRRAWKTESERQGTAFRMRSGREFGVFS